MVLIVLNLKTVVSYGKKTKNNERTNNVLTNIKTKYDKNKKFLHASEKKYISKQ